MYVYVMIYLPLNGNYRQYHCLGWSCCKAKNIHMTHSVKKSEDCVYVKGHCQKTARCKSIVTFYIRKIFDFVFFQFTV